MQPPQQPPKSLHELRQRAEQIAGLTLGDLANMAALQVPENFKREKGWSGQLLELWLGATAGSKPQQDFPELGVELKTLPINAMGAPCETTYVCYAPLLGIEDTRWETSNVRNKLQQVLWIPVVGDRHIPPAQRTVGSPIFWSPDHSQLAQLQADWEELMERISLGEIESVTARTGEFLQLRPKAADGQQLTDAIGKHGRLIKTRPRGFYLRKAFTQQILNDAFGFENL
ncbi:DNA mismatch repair endonuclease MutH [Alteromonas oceanisediminis]|uniref:DNA mismatch repair endonuclease MutH n=1 Tax=Alteromonas oceanisediminis TaxID=2836180 RepID=UPI001BDB48D8|nr:DNA mismatch repair endonuclease MutH [Alteromonas oceanisediminis]MBT0585378.1 DNA mismatch repair endonuclease MutH [Alteromonas oceanisediminis]